MQETGRLVQSWAVWKVLLRFLMGFYWLYFSSQKWFDESWVKPVLEQSAETNPISVYKLLLTNYVLSNWLVITRILTITEAIVGILLLIGLFTRIAGTVGAILASNYLLSFLGSLNEPALVWFYILSATASLTVALSDSGKTLGIDRIRATRKPKSPLRLW